MAPKKAKATDAPALEAPAEGKRLRTEPTKPPTSGGAYDGETGDCLKEPPQEQVHQRGEE